MRPDRGLLLELRALLDLIEGITRQGRDGYDSSQERRWVLQRLWIAVGNTAEQYRRVEGIQAGEQPWSRLVEFRNVLAHTRLAEIDDAEVWRTSTLRAGPLRGLADDLIRKDADAL